MVVAVVDIKSWSALPVWLISYMAQIHLPNLMSGCCTLKTYKDPIPSPLIQQHIDSTQNMF